MDYKRFGGKIVARLDAGDEIHEQLRAIAEREQITLANISALGATNDLTVGVFSLAEKQYHAHHFTGDMEIVSLVGTITTMNGEYYAHLHISAADTTGRMVGGHLNRAVISITCEMVIDIIHGQVDRQFNPEVGINALKF